MSNSNRRFWIAFGSLLLLLLAGVIVMATVANSRVEQQEVLNNRSIYNGKPSGYKAWFLTLQEAGIQPHVWRAPFQKLNTLPTPATMLLIEPYTAVSNKIVFGKREVQAMLRWVEAGNTLIVLDPFKRASAGMLLHELNLEEPKALPLAKLEALETLKAYPLHVNAQSPWVGNYIHGFLQTDSVQRFQPALEETALLLDAANRPVVREVAYGQGKFIVGTVADMASNRFLQEPNSDNYQFLSNLVLRERKPLYINEFIHGYGVDTDIFSYYSKTPLGKVFIQLGFGFIFLLWISCLQWRPVRKPPAGKPRHYTLEYLQSLASIYFKAQSASLVVSPQINRIEHLLRTRYRMQLEEAPRLQPLLQELFPPYSNKEAGKGSAAQDPMQWLQKAQRVVADEKKLSAPALLKLSKQLSLIEERLRHGNTPS